MKQSLLSRYAGLICDLDGVVYAGPDAIDHAVPALNVAKRPVVYATNNASRPPSGVAEHLCALGLKDVTEESVINSSMAAAHIARERLKANATVLCVGGDGVFEAVSREGMTALSPEEARKSGMTEGAVAAVIQGYGPHVQAQDLAAAAYAIQRGAVWIATNTDKTLPTDQGTAPGNGSLIQAVRNAVKVDPVVVGKPEPVMYEMARERMGLEGTQVLAIGDRLETDIAGAVRAGMDSVLVLTGVHTIADAAAAPSSMRPTYVLADLGELSEPYDNGIASPHGGQATPDGLGPSPMIEGKHFALDGDASLPVLRACLREVWRLVDDGEWSPDEAREAMERIS